MVRRRMKLKRNYHFQQYDNAGHGPLKGKLHATPETEPALKGAAWSDSSGPLWQWLVAWDAPHLAVSFAHKQGMDAASLQLPCVLQSRSLPGQTQNMEQSTMMPFQQPQQPS